MAIQDIRLLLTDVDGVLTNGKIYMSVEEEWIQFDIQDGIGQRLAACGDLPVGWLSGRVSKPVAERAKHLKVPYLMQGKLDKVVAAEKLCEKLDLKLSEVAFIASYWSSKIDFESYNNLPIKVDFPSSTLPAVVKRNNSIFM